MYDINMFIEEVRQSQKDERKLNELIEYDFKNQMAELLNHNRIRKEKREKLQNLQDKSSIEKFKIYKNDFKYDCDCSKLANDIYEKLWECEIVQNKPIRYSSKKFENNLKMKLSKIEKEDKISEILSHISLERDTINSFQRIYNKFPQKQDSFFKEFAKLTHSIGNFTMLLNPNEEKYKQGFNRGRNAKTMDFWDLSLMLMREELYLRYGEKVGKSIFETYIDTFYLNEYVDNEYNVKPLIKNEHRFDWKNKNKLQFANIIIEEAELENYAKNVTYKIRTRGKKMIKELANKKA